MSSLTDNQKARALFLCNYTEKHVIGFRAARFADSIRDVADVEILYRSEGMSHLRLLGASLRAAARFRPHLVVTFDGFPLQVAAALLRWTMGTRYVVDLAGTRYNDEWLGTGFPAGLLRQLEIRMMQGASAVTCRGLLQRVVYAAKHYNPRVVHLSEIVDCEVAQNYRPDGLREHHGLANALTLGAMGSICWNDELQWCYGREIVEVLARTKGMAISGVLLPSVTSTAGSVERVRALADSYGVADRLVALTIPRADVPRYLQLIDICVSTQIGLTGELRTTAKLPEYMACGKYVLATRVGDARFYLPEEMLIEFDNLTDYYNALAERVVHVYENRAELEKGRRLRETALRYCDANVVADRARAVFLEVLRGPGDKSRRG